jgi:hypothetical protein
MFSDSIFDLIQHFSKAITEYEYCDEDKEDVIKSLSSLIFLMCKYDVPVWNESFREDLNKHALERAKTIYEDAVRARKNYHSFLYPEIDYTDENNIISLARCPIIPTRSY